MGERDEGRWVRGEDGGGEEWARPQSERRLPVCAAFRDASPSTRARSIHFQVERVLLLFDALAADTPARAPTQAREFPLRGHGEARRAGVPHGA